METSLSPERAEGPERLAFPVPLVCPVGHTAPLRRLGEGIHCGCDHPECPKAFGFVDGFPDLVVGGRFDDPTDAELMCYEERSNAHTARRFWAPMFQRIWPEASRGRRLLALGCGTGVEVDVLSEAGFECVGIDCGNRTKSWPRREQAQSLLLANGLNLPFEDETFDGVFCGCVFPHVGVVGDTFEVAERYRQDRLDLAREISRVLRPGGHALVSSPNRMFPFDLFHGRESGSLRVRPYWPGDPFLLSVGDYRDLFREAGCRGARPEPVEGYWGFVGSRGSLKGRVMGAPARLLFWLCSREPLRFLRATPVAPWIVVRVTR